MGCLQSSFLNDQQLDFSKNRSGEKSWTPADIPDDAIVPLGNFYFRTQRKTASEWRCFQSDPIQYSTQ